MPQMKTTMLLTALSLGAAGVLPGAARADQITETVSNSQAINLTNPPNGPQSLVPDSFFDATFSPFSSIYLYDATVTLSFSFVGTQTTGDSGGGGSLSFGGTENINGEAFAGGGNGSSSGGDPDTAFPLEVDYTGSADLLNGDPVIAAEVTGTDPFSFTFNAGSDYAPVGITALQGTLTTTETVTFDVPEPGSLLLLGTAVLGLGVLRRRRVA